MGVPTASADPSNTVGFVQVVILLAVAVQRTCQGEIGKLAAARRGLGLRTLGAVQIAVEDGRVTIDSEENEAIRQGLVSRGRVFSVARGAHMALSCSP